MAAAKPEAAPPPSTAPAKDAAAAASAKEAPAAGEATGKAPAKGIAAFIPLIAVVILAPALSWAVGQFVLLPQLKKELAAPVDPHAAPAAEEPAAEEHEAEGGHGKKGEAGTSNTYEFTNIVVNLSGTMGTRYLKTTFIVTGADKTLRGTFESNKPRLIDVTLNVLSSLSLTDLEEAGAKNLIREKLIGAYNQALGKKVAEQVFFSDFVVQ